MPLCNLHEKKKKVLESLLLLYTTRVRTNGSEIKFRVSRVGNNRPTLLDQYLYCPEPEYENIIILLQYVTHRDWI